MKPQRTDLSLSSKDRSKSFHKTAWGRVRNIIRKDSGKRKRKSGGGGGAESEEASEADGEEADGRSPRTSPLPARHGGAPCSESPPGGAGVKVGSPSSVDMASRLGECLSCHINSCFMLRKGPSLCYRRLGRISLLQSYPTKE